MHSDTACYCLLACCTSDKHSLLIHISLSRNIPTHDSVCSPLLFYPEKQACGSSCPLDSAEQVIEEPFSISFLSLCRILCSEHILLFPVILSSLTVQLLLHTVFTTAKFPSIDLNPPPLHGKNKLFSYNLSRNLPRFRRPLPDFSFPYSIIISVTSSSLTSIISHPPFSVISKLLLSSNKYFCLKPICKHLIVFVQSC